MNRFGVYHKSYFPSVNDCKGYSLFTNTRTLLLNQEKHF